MLKLQIWEWSVSNAISTVSLSRPGSHIGPALTSLSDQEQPQFPDPLTQELDKILSMIPSSSNVLTL